VEIGKTSGTIGIKGTRAEGAAESPARQGYLAGSVDPGQAGYPATQPQDLVMTAGGAAAPGRQPARSAQTILSMWVAADPASLKLLEQVRRIAASASTVLLRGESGVGKDLLAQLLHYLGPNPDEPLVKIDCASLPVELLESELFGYERGAFTGATQAKHGRLETAGAGTLVLDEVASLSMPMQAKLLRVLEEKRFERLGGTRTLTVNARVVALTNVDLERAVSRRSFREDLYFRLNVVPIIVPPLRERPGDIRPLAERFLRQMAEVHRRPQMTLAPAALAALQAYTYPGNVRELRNLIERAVVNGAAPELLLQDLPSQLRECAPGAQQKQKISLEELERAYIAEVLDYTRGKKTMAANILGISRKTLLEKRKRYGLD
jgi:two-component system response regulator AtoC